MTQLGASSETGHIAPYAESVTDFSEEEPVGSTPLEDQSDASENEPQPPQPDEVASLTSEFTRLSISPDRQHDSLREVHAPRTNFLGNGDDTASTDVSECAPPVSEAGGPSYLLDQTQAWPTVPAALPQAIVSFGKIRVRGKRNFTGVVMTDPSTVLPTVTFDDIDMDSEDSLTGFFESGVVGDFFRHRDERLPELQAHPAGSAGRSGAQPAGNQEPSSPDHNPTSRNSGGTRRVEHSMAAPSPASRRSSTLFGETSTSIGIPSGKPDGSPRTSLEAAAKPFAERSPHGPPPAFLSPPVAPNPPSAPMQPFAIRPPAAPISTAPAAPLTDPTGSVNPNYHPFASSHHYPHPPPCWGPPPFDPYPPPLGGSYLHPPPFDPYPPPLGGSYLHPQPFDPYSPRPFAPYSHPPPFGPPYVHSAPFGDPSLTSSDYNPTLPPSPGNTLHNPEMARTQKTASPGHTNEPSNATNAVQNSFNGLTGTSFGGASQPSGSWTGADFVSSTPVVCEFRGLTLRGKDQKVELDENGNLGPDARNHGISVETRPDGKRVVTQDSDFHSRGT